METERNTQAASIRTVEAALDAVTEGGIFDWLDRLDKVIASCEHEWHQMNGGLLPILAEDVPGEAMARAADYTACEIAARIERAVGQINFLQRNIEYTRNRIRI